MLCACAQPCDVITERFVICDVIVLSLSHTSEVVDLRGSISFAHFLPDCAIFFIVFAAHEDRLFFADVAGAVAVVVAVVFTVFAAAVANLLLPQYREYLPPFLRVIKDGEDVVDLTHPTTVHIGDVREPVAVSLISRCNNKQSKVME